MKKKIALFYPWIKSKGGAEKVLLEILKNSTRIIDVYTWIYEPKSSFEEFKKFKIKVIAPRSLRKLGNSKILRGFFFPISLFFKIPLEEYNYFLIYTTGVGELIVFKNYKKGKTKIYSNSPLRYASKDIMKWNMKNSYKSPLSKISYWLSVKIYNFLEKKAWKKIENAFFISETSRRRAIEKGLISESSSGVIYPPVNIKNKKGKTKEGNYFLYISRFNPPKRQDVLLNAWKEFSKKHPNEKLVLGGYIENKKYFSKIKKVADSMENVSIQNNMDETEQKKLYENCKAVIFIPFKEDFGIVPFEALAFGKPIIGIDEGGYVELIKDSPDFYPIKEGFDSEKTAEEINKTLERFLKEKRKKGKKLRVEETNPTKFIKEIEKGLK